MTEEGPCTKGEIEEKQGGVFVKACITSENGKGN